MSGHFESLPDGGAAVALDEVEISIIRSLSVQLLELIGPGPGEGEAADPLDELFAEGPSEPPADPVLKRLFPDAYSGPEGSADETGPAVTAADEEERRGRSAEFRRFTENDLRARKREDALAVIRSLDSLSLSREGAEPGDADREVPLELLPEQSQQWLRTLNDLRLAIGSRLDIVDEEDADLLYRLPDTDPRKPMVLAYLWLGDLQETLVGTLLP
ncbi:DUF2017 domain-containing protein [Streptomyces sp. NA04227]|uniref:DUF2017 domain-containing protein n=1 Tax=Streptomyces sp. NA04227 TaxID=2742136 RepID=UPI0015910A91|nr:DUF2017 domain-containing protein [Streptomyces sp. NA04227]QKW06762.1 DUF2017 domain-containing protein [Streptomyces sp. NA04227]